MGEPSPLSAAGDPRLVLPGASLRYRDTGAGPALLLLHGWALDLDVWEPCAQRWAGRFRVLRHDRRGFGLSTGEPSLAADVEDALALLDARRVPRAVVIGASQGARAALRLAIARPERVAAVVLDGPSNELSAAVELPLAEYRALALGGDLAGVRRRWASHPFTRLVTPDASAHQRVAACIERYPGRDLLGPGLPAPPAELSACRGPALVISGALDLESRQASAEALARALPAAEHVRIAGAGHLPHLDRPDAYDAVVLQFCERALATAGGPAAEGPRGA